MTSLWDYKKIAVDIHGVIDQDPNFFRTLMEDLMNAGWEVHILTGRHVESGIIEELQDLRVHEGVHYSHLFSIADYHRSIGTEMWGDINNPWMDDTVWSRTKADYCIENNISFCIDDTDRYIGHFKSGVARYYRRGSDYVRRDKKESK